MVGVEHQRRRQRVVAPLGGTHRLVNPAQPLQWVGQLRWQLGDHHRDPVAERPDLLSRSHGDGNGAHQRFGGQFAALVEPAPQPGGAHGEHHIVDRAPERVLDLFDVGERHRPEGDPAMA